MSIAFALFAIIALFVAMAVVGVTINEFTRQMETLRKSLEARYSLEAPKPPPKPKPAAESKGQKAPAGNAPAGNTPLDALLRKPKA